MSFYTSQPDFTEVRRFWLVFFLLGALLVVAGFVAIICATATSLISILIWGWMLLVRGVLEAASAIWARRFSASLLHLLLGILGVVIGVLILSQPDKAVDIMTLLLAAFLLIGGLLQALAALFLLFPGWIYSLGSGVLAFVIGLLVLRDWEGNDWFIGVCVGIELLTRGSAWVGLALNLKKLSAATPPDPG